MHEVTVHFCSMINSLLPAVREVEMKGTLLPFAFSSVLPSLSDRIALLCPLKGRALTQHVDEVHRLNWLKWMELSIGW
jgi:hypothetical protein